MNRFYYIISTLCIASTVTIKPAAPAKTESPSITFFCPELASDARTGTHIRASTNLPNFTDAIIYAFLDNGSVEVPREMSDQSKSNQAPTKKLTIRYDNTIYEFNEADQLKFDEYDFSTDPKKAAEAHAIQIGETAGKKLFAIPTPLAIAQKRVSEKAEADAKKLVEEKAKEEQRQALALAAKLYEQREKAKELEKERKRAEEKQALEAAKKEAEAAKNEALELTAQLTEQRAREEELVEHLKKRTVYLNNYIAWGKQNFLGREADFKTQCETNQQLQTDNDPLNAILVDLEQAQNEQEVLTEQIAAERDDQRKRTQAVISALNKQRELTAQLAAERDALTKILDETQKQTEAVITELNAQRALTAQIAAERDDLRKKMEEVISLLNATRAHLAHIFAEKNEAQRKVNELTVELKALHEQGSKITMLSPNPKSFALTFIEHYKNNTDAIRQWASESPLQFLGLPSSATTKDIETTKKALAIIWHADRWSDDPQNRSTAEKIFKLIGEAVNNAKAQQQVNKPPH